MSRSFKIQEYQITVGFKSETFMSINAEHLATQEMFSNEAVELMRIKRDTVLATLQRKSEKNLSCECEQYLKDGIKYLGVIFVVNFDYLPEFRQELELQLVDRKEQGSKLQMNNCHAQIQYISSVIDSFEKDGKLSAEHIAQAQMGMSTFSWTKTLPKGAHILRVSGIIVQSTGINSSKEIKFLLTVPGKKSVIEIPFTMYIMSTHVCPFNFTEIVDCEGEGEVQLRCQPEGGYTVKYNTVQMQLQVWVKDVIVLTQPIFAA